ncbi:putative glutamine amidotransferase [Pseudobutyrivibrio sp. 49]|uniref:gamma-glutamyl-gamma-aminobutyrate hydrolase family protein n=1 Tax=Pseudobutyrivibrio sp. 49 TaxID=1855344 RepID=UPI0008881757|nr:gamma-glutamyl-gamma-aminobutyrate hydrolase family protein [Pseudobutyrivibrio sp. 49]SDH35018.1 putative glutamine amidotransferase [Pseudobutyrivibrio sp. 49]
MRPIIGLIPLYDDEKESLWMLPGYMKAVEACGGVPVMLPLTTDEQELEGVYRLCNGILFTGGHDVSPSEYGALKTAKCGKSCETRDFMEGYLLDRCIQDDKPLLGICRGIQFINAHLGGTLYQDLPSEYNEIILHHMEPPYDRIVHKVDVSEYTKLSEIIGAGTHGVNSYHHQAIKRLAPILIQSAVSEDGLVEAIEIIGHSFGLAVQWHPEFSYHNNEDSKKIIQAFIDACK